MGLPTMRPVGTPDKAPAHQQCPQAQRVPPREHRPQETSAQGVRFLYTPKPTPSLAYAFPTSAPSSTSYARSFNAPTSKSFTLHPTSCNRHFTPTRTSNQASTGYHVNAARCTLRKLAVIFLPALLQEHCAHGRRGDKSAIVKHAHTSDHRIHWDMAALQRIRT